MPPDRHPATTGETWTVHGPDGLLAELVVTEGDFPWLYARVVPRDGLAAVRPLFADDLRLLEELETTGDPEAWEELQVKLRKAVFLRYPDGRDVPEFLLHLDGDEAWWRWHDEPFDDD